MLEENSIKSVYNSINKSLSFKERLAFNGFVNMPILTHFEGSISQQNFSDLVYTIPESLKSKSLNDIVTGLTEKQRKDKTMQDITVLNRKINNIETQVSSCKDGNQLVRLQHELEKTQNEINKVEFTTDLKHIKELSFSYEESNHLSLIKANIANKILASRGQEILINPDLDQDKLDVLEVLFEDFVLSSNIDTSFLLLKKTKV